MIAQIESLWYVAIRSNRIQGTAFLYWRRGWCGWWYFYQIFLHSAYL